MTATATLTNVTATDEYAWQWTSAPVTAWTPVGPAGVSQGVPGTHDYPAPGPGTSTYTFKLHLRRGDCEVASVDQPVPVPSCGLACPAITAITDTAGDCTTDRTARAVELDATLTGPAVTTYEWAFGDGATETRAGSSGAKTSHTYAAPGTYTVTLTATGPGNCTTKSAPHQVMVAGCCPEVTAITTSAGTCVPGSGGQGDVQPVTLSAQTRGSGIAGYTWDFGDGTTAGPPSQATPPPHNYPAPGTYTASVTVTSTDPTCPPSTASTTVTIPPCSPVIPPVTGCGILRLVIVLLIAALAVTIAGVYCFNWPWYVPVVVAVVLLLLILLWIFLCRPSLCTVLLTLWQAAFSAFAVLLYMWKCLDMAGCSTFGLWAWIIAAIIAVALFILWLIACRPSECIVWSQLLLAVIDAGALLGLITAGGSWLSTIFSGLSGCLLAGVPAGLAIAALVLTLIIAFRRCLVTV